MKELYSESLPSLPHTHSSACSYICKVRVYACYAYSKHTQGQRSGSRVLSVSQRGEVSHVTMPLKQELNRSIILGYSSQMSMW